MSEYVAVQANEKRFYQGVTALVINSHISRDMIDLLKTHWLKGRGTGTVGDFFANEKMRHSEFFYIVELVAIKTDNFVVDSIMNIKQPRKSAGHDSSLMNQDGDFANSRSVCT
jgi:hypothetical protein